MPAVRKWSATSEAKSKKISMQKISGVNHRWNVYKIRAIINCYSTVIYGMHFLKSMNLKLNKEQAAKDVVQQFIDFIAEGHVIDKIVVTGWASPEGEESRNQDLSKNRTAEGEKWFNKQFENYLHLQYLKFYVE